MNAIDTWREAKSELDRFKKWRKLIGAPFQEPGRGRGVGRVQDAVCSLTIYNPDGGSKDSHPEPSMAIRGALREAALAKSEELLDHAQAVLEKAVAEAAKEARTIVEAILADSPL